MKKRISGIVGVLLASFAAWAEPVTESMALAAAKSWLRENPAAAPNMQVTGETRAERAADGSVLWYEVRTSPDGCIITSSDTRIDPVVSVVENWGTGLPSDHPLRALLESDMTARLAALRTARPALMTASPTRVPSNEVRWRRLANPPLKQGGLKSVDFEVNFITEWREKYLTHWNQGSAYQGLLADDWASYLQGE